MSCLKKNNLSFTDDSGRTFIIGFGNSETSLLPIYSIASEKSHYIPTCTRAYCTSVIDYRTIEVSGYISNTLSKFIFRISNIGAENATSSLSYLQNSVLGSIISISDISWYGSGWEANVRLESQSLGDLF